MRPADCVACPGLRTRGDGATVTMLASLVPESFAILGLHSACISTDRTPSWKSCIGNARFPPNSIEEHTRPRVLPGAPGRWCSRRGRPPRLPRNVPAPGHLAPVDFDEAQYIPHLFPYVTEKIDQSRQRTAQYLPTGSQNLSLARDISESLAGRSACFRSPGARRRGARICHETGTTTKAKAHADTIVATLLELSRDTEGSDAAFETNGPAAPCQRPTHSRQPQIQARAKPEGRRGASAADAANPPPANRTRRPECARRRAPEPGPTGS